jgi:hypothetical protein
MHNGALRKMALALTFWLALHVSSLRAQIFTNDLPLQANTTGTDPVDFEFRADGTLIAMGNYGVGSLLSGDQGQGTRMLWFPSLAAFRAGAISGSGYANYWDQSNIGAYSVAFGENNLVSGSNASGFGNENRVTGDGATSFGYGNLASGLNSTTLGQLNSASGYLATAIGALNVVTGSGSIASGTYNMSSGYVSTTMGGSNTASGMYSTASGYYTQANAYVSFSMGYYNIGGGNPNTWVSTDPLFEIGNGTPTTPSDALIVYKNGSATFQGPVTVAPGGDIPMYTGE